MGSVVSLGDPLVSNTLRLCRLLGHIDASEFQLLLRLFSVPEPNERTSCLAVKTNILRNVKAVFFVKLCSARILVGAFFSYQPDRGRRLSHRLCRPRRTRQHIPLCITSLHPSLPFSPTNDVHLPTRHLPPPVSSSSNLFLILHLNATILPLSSLY